MCQYDFESINGNFNENIVHLQAYHRNNWELWWLNVMKSTYNDVVNVKMAIQILKKTRLVTQFHPV